jgi:hypothetical protein
VLVSTVDGVDVGETRQAVARVRELCYGLHMHENICAWSGDESLEYVQLAESTKIEALTKAFDTFCGQDAECLF